MGGALGRWLFHCHIFIHHHQGMISELVVSDADGRERPHVDVAGSWSYTPVGGIAQRHGTYHHPDGDPVSLTATAGVLVDNGGGNWSWTYDATGAPPHVEYVYVTATDPAGRADQTVFRLKVGAPDDGSDNGDPHVHTVDGKHYDFQGAGEFVLLRDHEGMEVQARHWPVHAANPTTDPATALTSCVSINTAVAARVGAHRIAYQPRWKGQHRKLEFFVDSEQARLPYDGIDLGEHRVTAFDMDSGATGLRVDYASQAVLMVTPHFWEAYGIWYMNVRASHTQADEGIMGPIPADGWLPLLPTRASVGPMPMSLPARHEVLYRKFADAWRVTDETSLFVYESGTSTKTVTDSSWPAPQQPCPLQPRFEIPGAQPPAAGLPERTAERLCQRVTDDALHRDCVFDVATTGDESFARGYALEQELIRRAASVQIDADKPSVEPGSAVTATATVLPLWGLGGGATTPTGTITFIVDGSSAGKPVRLDKRGRAKVVLTGLDRGQHGLRAEYGGGGPQKYRPCSSGTVVVAVGSGQDGHDPHHASA